MTSRGLRPRSLPSIQMQRAARGDCGRLFALFWRGWRQLIALAAGFRFGLRFRRFLDFLFAFIFASHGSKHDTKGLRDERDNANCGAGVTVSVAVSVTVGVVVSVTVCVT